MNSRERLTAVTRGGSVDRAPWFVWSPNASYVEQLTVARQYKPDAIVTSSQYDAELFLEELGEDGPAVLFETPNPFGFALQDELDLNISIQLDPAEGDVLHSKYTRDVADLMAWALAAGCDGIFYRLVGATPQWSTPMQYGGNHLERDRELLETVCEARFNVVFVEGGDGVFLDFVADLPSSAFAWDEEESGASPAEVRTLREGALACGLKADRAALWDSFGGTGLVFFGKSTLDEDFDEIALECGRLRSPAPHE